MLPILPLRSPLPSHCLAKLLHMCSNAVKTTCAWAMFIHHIHFDSETISTCRDRFQVNSLSSSSRAFDPLTLSIDLVHPHIQSMHEPLALKPHMNCGAARLQPQCLSTSELCRGHHIHKHACACSTSLPLYHIGSTHSSLQGKVSNLGSEQHIISECANVCVVCCLYFRVYRVCVVCCQE